jgi:outer membrane protein assembly factor BamA
VQAELIRTPHPDDATVYIAVIEAQTKRFEGGLGYSTDVKFRTNATYRDVNFDGHGLQFQAVGRIEAKIQ